MMRIDDRSVGMLLRAERSVLILTRSNCQQCHAYEREVSTLLQLDMLRGVLVGRLVVDRGGVTRFRQTHPWAGTLQVLPYPLLNRRGVRVEEFAAARASYLFRRIQIALFDAPPGASGKP